MKRPYALPIALAAGLHAALLFGFGNSSPGTVGVTGAKPPADTLMPPHVLDLLPPDTADTPATEPAGNAPPTFQSPEPLPTTRPSPFELDVKRETAPPPDGPVTAILRFAGTGVSKDAIAILGGTGSILTSGDLDATPRTRFQAAPIYPHEKRREGAEGVSV